MKFGAYIRKRRELLRQRDPRHSLRQTAGRVGIEPAYLSKIERGEFAPPGEGVIRALAADLDEDVDILLAMAGKVSTDLLEIIRKHPAVFADLIRQLRDAPENVLLRVVREVRDGKW